MEFKKNRQRVITESVSLLKAPDFNLSTPAFLSDAATVKVIKDRIHDVKKRVEKDLRDDAHSIGRGPAHGHGVDAA